MGDYTTALVFGLILVIALVLFVRNTVNFFKEGRQEDLPGQNARVKPTSSSTSGATSPRVTSGASKIVIGLDRAKGGGPAVGQKSKEPALSVPKAAATEKPKTEVIKREVKAVKTANPEPPKPAGKESPGLKAVDTETPKVEQATDMQAKVEVKVAEEKKPQEAVAEPEADTEIDVAGVDTNDEKPGNIESKWPPVRMQGPKEEDGKTIEKIENVLSKYFEK